MYQLVPIPILDDNYVWLLRDDVHAWVVDPGDARPVRDYIVQHGLKLADILVTHHHHDHVNGIPELLPMLTGRVIGASKRPVANMRISELVAVGDEFTLSFSDLSVRVLDTSGHTFDQVAYLIQDALAEPLLFCGDAIFSAGCGRIFDGTMQDFYQTMQRIDELPPQTILACTHEYTLANLAFCLALNPTHEATQAHQNQVKYARALGQPSLPTTLVTERMINPYLRSLHMDADWLAALNSHGANATTAFEVFAATRTLKDSFKTSS